MTLQKDLQYLNALLDYETLTLNHLKIIKDWHRHVVKTYGISFESYLIKRLHHYHPYHYLESSILRSMKALTLLKNLEDLSSDQCKSLTHLYLPTTIITHKEASYLEDVFPNLEHLTAKQVFACPQQVTSIHTDYLGTQIYPPNLKLLDAFYIFNIQPGGHNLEILFVGGVRKYHRTFTQNERECFCQDNPLLSTPQNSVYGVPNVLRDLPHFSNKNLLHDIPLYSLDYHLSPIRIGYP